MAKTTERGAKTEMKAARASTQKRARTAVKAVDTAMVELLGGQPELASAGRRRPTKPPLDSAPVTPSARSSEALAPAGLAADATDKLKDGAIAFGDVLRSIGNAVVIAQAALDDAAIETAKQLSDTKLKIAVAIKQDLDDNGNLEDGTEIDTRLLSLSNFILPTLHQWEHVAVSMDLTVGEIDAATGISVKTASVSAGVSGSRESSRFGLQNRGTFSAAGEFNYSATNAESRFRAEFSSGEVRLDALLGPRESFRYPEIADFAVGPQILINQTTAKTAATEAPPNVRQVNVKVQLRQFDGRKYGSNRSVDVRIPPQLLSRLVSSVAGSVVVDKDDGIEFKLTLTPAANQQPTQSHRLAVKFGDLVKSVDVVI